jgi:hypothetical protein
MPRCPLCTVDPANPVFHRSMRQCPKRGNLLKKEPVRAQITSPAPSPGPPGAPGPGGRPIDETKAPTPVEGELVAKPAEKPKKKLLGFLTRETKAIATEVSKPKQEFDWILPEEANARLWQSALSFVRQTLNLFNRFLGMPPIPDEIMRFGKSDLDSINEAFRAPTSKFLYSMGFRTVEQAVWFTLVFSGFSLFGLMVVQLGMWYWENLPKSEKFIAWRAKARDRAVAFRERALAERAARAAQREEQRALAGARAPGTAPG